jgi:hypothetical protein
MAIVGNVDVLSRDAVVGWAADLEAPDVEIEVIILMDGRPIGQVVANKYRSDLQQIGRFGRGYHGFTFRFSSVPIMERHQVTVHAVGREMVLPNGAKEFDPVAVAELERQLTELAGCEMTPIIVTHIPRSGSTFLMDILSRHNKIIVARHYPYEVKVAMYYALASAVMTSPGDHERSGAPTEFMRQSFTLPFDPYNHPEFYDVFEDDSLARFFFNNYAAAKTQEFCRSMATKFYNMLSISERKGGALYFAEKCELNNRFRLTLRKLFPQLKELVLIRDLRDTYCSYRKYFVNKTVATPEYAMGVIRNSAEILLSIKERDDPSILFVRYEDCLLNPAVALRGVYDFLGIEMGPISVGADQAKLFGVHATSASPAESIGRWKQDLVGDERETFCKAVAPFLKSFGYET